MEEKWCAEIECPLLLVWWVDGPRGLWLTCRIYLYLSVSRPAMTGSLVSQWPGHRQLGWVHISRCCLSSGGYGSSAFVSLSFLPSLRSSGLGVCLAYQTPLSWNKSLRTRSRDLCFPLLFICDWHQSPGSLMGPVSASLRKVMDHRIRTDMVYLLDSTGSFPCGW